MSKNSKTFKLVSIAFLIALQVVLTRFVGIPTPYIRISFGYLPIVVIAILYGPIWAGTSYAIGDLLGSYLFPIGAPFFGFTLSAFLTGIIYGIVLHKKRINLPRVLLSCILVHIGVNLVLNTYWLSILMGKGYMALLPTRAIKNLIETPVATFLILIVSKALKSSELSKLEVK